MIPKRIHYCWFGGSKKPELVENCIKTWEEHFKGYRIIEWNEGNITELDCDFAIKAYEKKKWAFVSDYVRLSVLYKEGGVYLDTDMYMLKSIDELLHERCFLGRQHDEQVNGCVIGCVPGHPFIKKTIEVYKSLRFDEYRLMNMAIPLLLTRLYNDYRSSTGNAVKIFPSDFFYPYPYESSIVDKNFISHIKPSSYGVHLWNTSWFSKKEFAGFAFKQKQFRKGTVLFFQFLLENPSYVARIPALISRYLQRKIASKAE